MPSREFSLPYGDAFIVQTPSLDRVAQQLYVQQQQRQLRQQQENQALDQMMQKEFANIRSVDTPDVVNSYNRYKQLKKAMLFDKDLHRDPLAYNQAQQAANEAYLDMNKQINQSREIKDMTKTMTTDRFKNPDAYADDYGQRVMALNSTPVSGLQNYPELVNWDNYRYRGSNTNFNDIVSKVYGPNRKIVGKEEALDKQGIQFRSPVYEYGAAPAQVYEGLVNSLDHKAERDASYKWKQLTPDVVQDIEKKYSEIPQDRWEQMGLAGPQKIDLRAASDAEKYMRLLAMQNAVNTAPRLVDYQKRTSDKAKRDYDFALDKIMEGIKFGHARQLKKEDQKVVDNWIVNYWDKRIGEAKSGQPTPFKDPNNPLTIKMAYHIDPDGVMLKALARNGRDPDDVFVTDDNKIMPVFYKLQEVDVLDDNGKKIGKQTVTEKDKDGNPVIDKEYGGPMKIDQAYLSMGYRGQTKKDLGGTMTGTYNESKNRNAPAASKKYKYDGKDITHKQLNEMGYTDEEINEAIKAGLIK